MPFFAALKGNQIELCKVLEPKEIVLINDLTYYELQTLVEKVSPGGINLLQIDTEVNKQKIIEFQN